MKPHSYKHQSASNALATLDSKIHDSKIQIPTILTVANDQYFHTVTYFPVQVAECHFPHKREQKKANLEFA